MSTRLLQIFAALNVVIALYNGGRFVLLGIAAVPGIASADLTQIAAPAWGLLDTWYRVLGWVWVSTGFMLAWITPAIETHTAWFRCIFVAFMCVGIGRLAAVVDHGVSVENTGPVIAIEIGIPLACIIWQGFVAKEAAVPPKRPLN
jgi:hypothetical protein